MPLSRRFTLQILSTRAFCFANRLLAKYIRFMVQIHLKDKIFERAALMLGVDVIIRSDYRPTFDVVAQWHVSYDT